MPFNTRTIDLIQPLSSMSYKVKALIYGPPGGGKTVFAADSPTPCLLDADGTGALSLFNHPELAVRTRVLQVRQYNQMLDVFEAYKSGDPRIRDVDTFVIDTLSQLTKKHLDEFIAKDKLVHESRDPVAYQRDYKFNTEAMRQLIGFFIDLDVNLVVLCHSETSKDEGSGVITTKPYLTPRLLSSMEAVFDVFGYMQTETDKDFNFTRTLQIMPSRRIWAKSRIGGLPPIILDPKFNQLLMAKEIMISNVQQYTEQLRAAQQAHEPPPPRPDGIILPTETVIVPEAESLPEEQALLSQAFIPTKTEFVIGTETPESEPVS